MRIISLTVIFVMIVLVSGCTLPFGVESNSEAVTFLGGDEGLEISFVSNNPPPRVFQNRNFNVLLRLENHGEQNIDEGKVRVLLSNAQTFGYDKEPIQYNADTLTKRLSTETGFIPGGIEFISFYDLSYSGSTMLTEDSPVSVAVDVCYPYKTTAVADLCVSREAAESDICEPLGEPHIDTTSGPLEVTKINQLYNGVVSYAESNNNVSVGIRIEFEIVGDGDIYSIDTDCDALDNEFWKNIAIDKITIGDDTYSGDLLIERCSSNELNLDEAGEGFINCDFTVEDVAYDFEERFTITLSYLHSQLLNKKISVMPVLESMKKCVTYADCNSKTKDVSEWDMYCEQPGFCRSKIPNGVECGLPASSAPVAITCESNKCYSYLEGSIGICVPDIREVEICQKSSDCDEGWYCSAVGSFTTGVCVPRIPNNYPCKTPLNAAHNGWSCQSGVCSTYGLCTIDQSTYGTAE